MEPVFTLPYSEYAAILELQKKLSKKEGAVFIPTTRQHKGVDFIIHKDPYKVLRIQVKSSKAYFDGHKIIGENEFTHHLWLNNFFHENRYEQGNADWYFIVGIYPVMTARSTSKTKSQKDWRTLVFCFREEEIFSMIDKNSKFTDIHFFVNEKGKVSQATGGRGFRNHPDLKKYLLLNRISDIKGDLRG